MSFHEGELKHFHHNMSFFDDFADADPISELLSNPNVSIIDVFNEGTMLQELRTNNEELIAYFAKENVISDLCNWSLTMKFQDNPTFDKYSRTATEVMTCKSGVAQGFVRSPGLRDFLDAQLTSTEEWDPMCAGHFQRIFLHLMEQSNGEYISKFNNFIPHLIYHISTLAVSEFIVMLTIQYYDLFTPNGEIVQALSNYIIQKDADTVSAAYSLRQLFNQGWENEKIQKDLCSDSLIGNLIQASKSTNSRLGQIELLRLANSIGQKNEMALIFRRGDIGDVPPPTTSSSALAAQVKGVDVKQAIQGIIDDHTHWTIIPTYMHLLQVAPVEEFLEAIKSSDMIAKLSNKQAEELTPFQLELVRVTVNRANGNNFDVSPLNTINQKAQKLWTTYGGDLPIGGQAEAKLNAD